MDALTRMIQMTRPQAGLDLRCQLSGSFEIPHEPAPRGTAPFHLILAGSCHIATDKGVLAARAGDFILFPRGGAHVIREHDTQGEDGAMRMRYDGMLPLRRAGKGKVGTDLLCGHFTHASEAGELLFKTLPDRLHVSLTDEEAPESLQAVVALMRQEASAACPGALAIVTALSQTLLVLALRRYSERPDRDASILAVLADARLGASAKAVLDAPGQPWTIEALGKLAAMSRASYARRFQQASGMTVFDFLTRVRMAVACELLRTTRRKVGDICFEVGYQSEAAFGKAFKLQIGELPGQYRRRHA
jgi:AraC family transcriptional activator of mtrCDE